MMDKSFDFAAIDDASQAFRRRPERFGRAVPTAPPPSRSQWSFRRPTSRAACMWATRSTTPCGTFFGGKHVDGRNAQIAVSPRQLSALVKSTQSRRSRQIHPFLGLTGPRGSTRAIASGE